MKNNVEKEGYNKRKQLVYLKPLLKKLIAVMALMNLIFYIASLIWGFDFKTLLGFVIGYLYVTACYVYIAYTIEDVVNMTVKKAKRLMMMCYAIRYTGLFLLCFLGIQFKFYNIIGIIISQFYPRIAFPLITFIERKHQGKAQ